MRGVSGCIWHAAASWGKAKWYERGSTFVRRWRWDEWLLILIKPDSQNTQKMEQWESSHSKHFGLGYEKFAFKMSFRRGSWKMGEKVLNEVTLRNVAWSWQMEVLVANVKDRKWVSKCITAWQKTCKITRVSRYFWRPVWDESSQTNLRWCVKGDQVELYEFILQNHSSRTGWTKITKKTLSTLKDHSGGWR